MSHRVSCHRPCQPPGPRACTSKPSPVPEETEDIRPGSQTPGGTAIFTTCTQAAAPSPGAAAQDPHTRKGRQSVLWSPALRYQSHTRPRRPGNMKETSSRRLGNICGGSQRGRYDLTLNSFGYFRTSLSRLIIQMIQLFENTTYQTSGKMLQNSITFLGKKNHSYFQF